VSATVLTTLNPTPDVIDDTNGNGVDVSVDFLVIIILLVDVTFIFETDTGEEPFPLNVPLLLVVVGYLYTFREEEPLPMYTSSTVIPFVVAGKGFPGITVQVTVSGLTAMEFPVASVPVAIHKVPFQEIPFIPTENEGGDATAVQDPPSGLVNIGVVPVPTATHKVPFHATALPDTLNPETCVQFNPSAL